MPGPAKKLPAIPEPAELAAARKTITVAFGGILSSTDPDVSDRVFNELLESGRPESRNSIAQQYASLQLAGQHAVRRGDLARVALAVARSDPLLTSR